jgi:HAE1 family hydrophobic/amphiphilic exporter-1
LAAIASAFVVDGNPGALEPDRARSGGGIDVGGRKGGGMTLSEISIKRPVMAWMLMSALIVFGAIGLGRLGVSNMPDIDFPVIDIRVTWDGAAPEVLETELVEQIEEEVIAIEGLKEMTSTIRQGGANVKLEFEMNRNIDSAIQEVQTAMTQLRLPLNVDPPKIYKSNPEDQPILWIGFGTKGKLIDLVRYADRVLLDTFQIVPGVGEIILGGSTERNLRIWVDNEKLRHYQLTVLDIVKAIELQHTELAAGYLENDKKEINVRTMGEEFSPQDIANILITQRGGQPIYDTKIHISDVAKVEDSFADVRRRFYVNGEEGVGLGIKKQRGSNEVKVAAAVKAKLEEIKPKLPPGVTAQINSDFSRFAEQSIHHTERELIIAALLTAVVCYLFLGSFTSAFNVILAIPTSILGTFLVLYFLGFTLNTFTLLALALAIGIVVDDAIMVLENIVRRFEHGEDRVTASRLGASQIFYAALATTLALVAIFLPVAFMKGVIGRFFFQFGVTISAAVLLSLVEALTLTPMRCSQFLSAGSGRKLFVCRWMDGLMDGGTRIYAKMLGVVLRHRWKVVIGAFLLFIGSLLLVTQLRSEFVPSQDQDFFRMSLRFPVGTSLTATNEKMKQLETYVRAVPEVQRVITNAGNNNGLVNEGSINVTLTPKDQRKFSQQDIVNRMRGEIRKLPGFDKVVLSFSDFSTRGLTSGRQSPIAFNIRGPDYAVLREKSEEIQRRLEATGLVADMDTDYKAGMPELRIFPDREAAALRGVSMDTLGRTINAAIGGIRQGKFTSDDARRYDVRIRFQAAERRNPENLEGIMVRTDYGELVSLRDFVKPKMEDSVQTVTRINRERSVSLFGNVTTGKSQADALSAVERIAREVLPADYHLYFEGSAQSFQESFESLLVALLLGIIVAYMVIASQYNSFVHPLTVLLAMPFGISGAFLTLWVFDQSLNLYSGIGIILLMGIVKKNSILLVDFTNQARFKDKLPLTAALMQACPLRLRPILMTSFATIGAAIPVALASGYGAEARSPMATSIIGGVLVSTFFTLFVIPCAYHLLAGLERKQPKMGAENLPS